MHRLIYRNPQPKKCGLWVEQNMEFLFSRRQSNHHTPLPLFTVSHFLADIGIKFFYRILEHIVKVHSFPFVISCTTALFCLISISIYQQCGIRPESHLMLECPTFQGVDIYLSLVHFQISVFQKVDSHSPKENFLVLWCV